MTQEQIQAIRNKYKNPLYMQEAINNVAGILADEYIRRGINTQEKEYKTMAKNKITELENVLLDQIEKLNDDSIADEPEKAKVLIERSQAISSLSKNIVEIQQLKLNVIKSAENTGGAYDKYLGIE